LDRIVKVDRRLVTSILQEHQQKTTNEHHLLSVVQQSVINALSAHKVQTQSSIKATIPKFEGVEEAKKGLDRDEKAYDVAKLDKIIEDASLILTNNNQNINK